MGDRYLGLFEYMNLFVTIWLHWFFFFFLDQKASSTENSYLFNIINKFVKKINIKFVWVLLKIKKLKYYNK